MNAPVPTTRASNTTIVDVLRERANEEPNRDAVTFLRYRSAGAPQQETLTYANLLRRAEKVAASLQTDCSRGDRALILCPPGLDYIAAFLGCILAGVVAVPAYPPRNPRHMERLTAIAADCGAKVALTTADLTERLVDWAAERRLAVVAVDALPEDAASAFRDVLISPADLAFLQYTSGTTGSAKGVMVGHDNLKANHVGWARPAFTAEDVLVSWVPPFHDLGLMGCVLQPLLRGFHHISMAPAAFLQDPGRWIRAMSQFRATITMAPNFAYEACLSMTDDSADPIDLSSLRVAIIGGEMVRADTIDRFHARFAQAGFRRESFMPGYGLAEATLQLTLGRLNEAPGVLSVRSDRTCQVFSGEATAETVRLVSAGPLIDDHTIRIVNPETRLCVADGEIGEVWAQGPAVARGYWGRPDATAETFQAQLAADPAAGMFMRTGDLGTLVNDEPYLLGRIKEMIIIRGQNHYAQDIESTVAQCHAQFEFDNTIAFAVEGDNEEKLVIVHCLSRTMLRQVDPPTLFTAIRRAVVEAHEVDPYAIVLVRPASLPRTTSGKLQRLKAREMFLSDALATVATWRAGMPLAATEYVAPSTLTEQAVAAAFADVLKRDKVGAQDGFFDLGGDSLLTARLLARLSDQTGKRLPLRTVFEHPTVAQLAKALDALSTDESAEQIPRADRAKALALSMGQRRLWFLEQQEGYQGAFTMGMTLEVTGRLDVAALEQALLRLRQRHELLCARVVVNDGRPLIQLAARPHDRLPIRDLHATAAAEAEAEIKAIVTQPLDIEREGLCDAVLLRHADGRHVLAMRLHHLAVDGYSATLIGADLSSFYAESVIGEAAQLPPIPYTYLDFVAWEQQAIDAGRFRHGIDFWRRIFGTLPHPLVLPSDRPRPAQPSYGGARLPVHIPHDVVRGLRRLAAQERVTLFMLLETAMAALLHRYSGAEDLVIATVVAGRSHSAFERVVGPFFNILALRHELHGDEPFRALLARSRAAILDAFTHQDVPFAAVVRAVSESDSGPLAAQPLFQVMFQAHTEAEAGAAFDVPLTGTVTKGRIIERELAHVDLEFDLYEAADGSIGGTLDYATDLFDHDRMQRLLGHYRRLLEAIVATPDAVVAELPLLDDAERAALLALSAGPVLDYPHDETIVDVFERQVRTTPDATALVTGTRRISFSKLDAGANRLAERLRAQGAGPETLVGLTADGSVAFFVGLWGIWKSGAGYLSLDPSLPEDRLDYIISDARPVILVDTGRMAARYERFAPSCQVIMADAQEAPDCEDTPVSTVPVHRPRAVDLCYVLYTSGSTGRPKGVAMPHAGLRNLCAIMQAHYPIEAGDRILQFCLPSFVRSLEEYVWAFCGGASLHLYPRDGTLDGEDLGRFIDSQGITKACMVPGALRVLPVRRYSTLRLIVVAGEALAPDIANAWSSVVDLRNEYGATETAGIFTASDRFIAGSVVTVGRPLGNLRVYILDPKQQLVPLGVPGEIYVAGPQVGRAYFGRSDLTAQRFLPEPFREASGTRAFRTGDIARWRADGTIEHLGRLDFQVQIRGMRVEPGEIETVLAEHPALAEAVVVGRQEAGGDMRLDAYLRPADTAVHADEADIRAHLRRKLPDYMIPSMFVWLDVFPKTPSGKIDRKALPLPAASRAANTEAIAGHGDFLRMLARTPEARRRRLLERHLLDCVGAVLERPEGLDPHTGFVSLGLNSLEIVGLCDQLNADLRLDPPLPPTVFFDYPTVAELVVVLQERLGFAAVPPSPAPTPALRRVSALDEPIAVVGLAVRAPGAEDLEAFWRLLLDGVDAIREMPRERFDLERYYDPDLEAAGKIYTRSGGFLEQIDGFDAAFFGISPREAQSMDPQQRLMLETCWQALEDGGFATPRLHGSRTGVYIGVGPSDFRTALSQGGTSGIDMYFGTGAVVPSVISGRVAFALGLSGPALSIDTACSSSLVAMHQACQALRTGDCDMALAGGVNVLLGMDAMVAFCRARMLSPDGRCMAFDAAANGYVRSEGAGAVVLKRLTDAERDGDRILAVIRSSALNQDGASSGLTVPSGPAQERLIRQAVAQAGLAPSDIAYLEAHGTGTSLGDPIELQAAARALGEGRDSSRPLLVGSVKTNVGHLEAASGIIAVAKVILALRHGVVPAQLHFRTPNPAIPWAQLPVEVVSQSRPWPEGRRIAGVNSFGFSGTNAHVVLEAYEPAAVAVPDVPAADRMQVLPLSAKSAKALVALAGRYADWLEATPDAALADVCFTAATGRSHFTHRAAIVAASRADLVPALAALRGGAEGFGRGLMHGHVTGTPRLAMLFTGQGSQYAGMARGLYDSEPVARAILDRCAVAVADELDHPLLEVMFATANSELAALLNNTRYAQPALFALQAALVALWRSVGVEPEAVVGHSVGEFAAAYAAGAVELEDAARLVARRGALMGALPAGGAMAAVFATAESVAAAIAKVNAGIGDGAGVSLAAENGTHRVISGPANLIDVMLVAFEAEGARGQRLTTSHAFHSALLDPMLDVFAEAAATVAFRRPDCVLVSNVTGTAVGDQDVLDAKYWRQHARMPVRFADGIATLAEHGVTVLLEIGSRATLGGMARGCWPGTATAVPAAIASLRPDTDDAVALAEATAQLYTAGVDIDFAACAALHGARRIELPTYPFDRQRHWPGTSRRGHAASGKQAGAGHPLLGAATHSAAGDVIYEQTVSAEEPGWLADHVVFDHIVMPGAFYVSAALSTMRDAPCRIGETQFDEPLILEQIEALEPQPRDVQAVLGPPDGGSGQRQFRVFSRPARSGGTDGADAWTLHATGQTCVAALAIAPEPPPVPETLIDADLATTFDTAMYNGLRFGPSFRGLVRLRVSERYAVGEIVAPDGVAGDGITLHPVVLDACFQTAGAVAGYGQTGLYVPIGCEGAELLAPPTHRLVCDARLRKQSLPDTAVIDIWLRNDAGAVFCRVAGLILKRVTRATMFGRQIRADHLIHVTNWRPVPLPAMAATAQGRWAILGTPGADRQVLATALRALGAEAHCVDSLDGGTSPYDGVVWLASTADAPLVDGPDAAAEVWLRTLLAHTQALSAIGAALPRGLVIVTDRAIAVEAGEPVHPLASAVWGFGRAVRAEQPVLSVRLIDLAAPLAQVTADALALALLQTGGEIELALRDGVALAPRLVPLRKAVSLSLPGDEPCRLEVRTPGALETLRLVRCDLPPPGPGELQVDVQAIGLNFRDVLAIMGLYPGDPGPLGQEYSGIVTAVGPGVTGFSVGDKVFGLAFGSAVTARNVPVATTRRHPVTLSHAAAATVPVTFCTALAAFDLANLREGERVLIHAGAGGVGMAAIQLALARGAEVHATASAAKQDRLRQLGVRHVYDSRSTGFAGAILAATDGAGVDVVLNSLTGPGFIAATLRALCPGGRFVEIAKRDIWTAEQMQSERPDVAYHVLALDTQTETESASQLQRVSDALAAGMVRPLPFRTYPMGSAAAAVQRMQAARHVGKLVLTVPHARPRENGAYLVTGGLGALGFAAATWLAENGAGTVVLVGRRGADSATAARIEALQARTGRHIVVRRADLSDRDSVGKLLAPFGTTLPALRGVVHAAGVLDDGMLDSQSWERFARVLAPKLTGAWLLHEATRDMSLDLFVLYTSIAGSLGAAGQSSYATANAALDGLARHRQALGLPVTSIAWGPWATGMAANERVRAQMAQRGLRPLETSVAHTALARLLRDGTTEAIVADVAWEVYCRGFDGRPGPLADLTAASASSATAVPILTKLRAVATADRAGALEAYVTGLVQQILWLPESPGAATRMDALGLDSLMMVELRNRLNNELRLDPPLSLAALLAQSTLRELAGTIAAQQSWGREWEPAAGTPAPTAAADTRPVDAHAIPEGRDLDLIEYFPMLWEENTDGDGGPLCTVSLLEGPLTELTLRRALEYVHTRHSVLRARIVGRDGRPRFEGFDAPIWLEWRSASGPDIMDEAVAHGSVADFRRAPALVRWTVVSDPERQRHALASLCHHSLMDGIGCMHLHDSVVAALRADDIGTLPTTVIPPVSVTSLLVKRFTPLSYVRLALSGWLSGKPAVIPHETRAPREERRTASVGVLLDVETTGRIVASCGGYGALPEHLAAAKAIAIHDYRRERGDDTRNKKPFRIFVPRSLRQELPAPYSEPGYALMFAAIGFYVAPAVADGDGIDVVRRRVKRRLDRVGSLPASKIVPSRYSPRLIRALRGAAPAPDAFNDATLTHLGAVNARVAGPVSDRLRLLMRAGHIGQRHGQGLCSSTCGIFNGQLLFVMHYWEPLLSNASARRILRGLLVHAGASGEITMVNGYDAFSRQVLDAGITMDFLQ